MNTPIHSDPTPADDIAQAALAALARAGLRAAEDARKTNTHMVIAENGKVRHISPEEYMSQRLDSGKALS